MKIGEYAKRNGISRDTIRHYIDLGLLFPLKKGAHYEFDEKSDHELNDILTFKQMGFTLQEIKQIFDFKRIGNLTHNQAVEYYKTFYNMKYDEINKKLSELEQMKRQLKLKIKELANYEPTKFHNIGIDLSTLPKLVCPTCNAPLSLKTGSITNNQILNGTLVCSCERSYEIEDGILCCNNNTVASNLLIKEDLIIDYVRETPSRYIDHIYKGCVWLERQYDIRLFENRTVLELGVGFGYYLRYIYKDLPSNTVYFAVDHDLGKLKYLKRLLERANIKKNIVFICTDFLDIPISTDSVDFVVDLAGSSNYAFDHTAFLLKEVHPLLKMNVSLIGSYLIYNKFQRDSPIGKELRSNFTKGEVIRKIEALGFKVISELSSEYQSEGGKYESYIHEGDEIYSHFIYAQRTD